MKPRIETFPGKKLAGKRMKMSVEENRTAELWRSFMPERKNIRTSIGTDLYSVQLYDPGYFDTYNPGREFEKWAVAEVSGSGDLPEGMEPLVIPPGMYAVFLYKGAASKGAETFRYIFGTWLPQSAYAPDDRPHFEILGEKYSNEDPDSEEEIWIPVKLKEH